MSLPSKVRKAKSTENSQVTKTSKTDSKQDSIKQSEKAQPTAEQMRIAQIIDTKTEDPSLKEKLKQVMDATQKSIDDAYTALHDCDNDPNRAVNLLLEGIESEWSTSSKKKKNRTSAEKNTKDKDIPPETPVEEETWDAVNSKLTVGSKTGNIRGRGRGFRGGGRVTTNSKNIDTNDRINRNTKVLNGPIRGRGSRGRPQSRGFGRGRGTFRRPIDTWDPQRPVSSNLNHDNSEDWDNEEYTGSLANSQIYTSSGTGNSPPSIHSSILGGSNTVVPDDFDKKNQLQVDISSVKAGNSLKITELNSLTIPFHKSFSTLPEPVITSPVGMRSPTMGSNLIMISPRAERNSMLMTSQPTKDESKISEKAITPPIGIRSPPMPPNLIMMTRNDRTNINNQEIRMHRPRPKIPPPSKIPATAVEMPPDSVENNIGLLDVQFGALELNETNDTIQVSPPSPHHSPSPVSSEKLLPHQSGMSDSLLLNETSFSPVRNNGATSIPQISDLTSKVSDVSSSLYPESTYQTSPYSKTAQQSPSVYSSTYSSGQITSTSSIIYSTSSSQSTYSSSTGGVYGGISSSYPQYQYNSYPSQQTQTLPILTNSTNSYQSVLGSQQYGSSSQSVYGTSGLPTPSYTTPYQTYNSTVQHNHKQALVSSSSSSSKEFETTQPSVNLSSISHSGSINPTPTLLSATQTTPTSKPTSISSMGKSTVVTNMPPGVPPLVGTHQYIMGQGGIPYFQQPMYYEDLQMMQQQRLAPHISTGYYEMGYPTSTTREGVQYNMNDGRFARTDNTSPVQASSISQQSGSQAHQQPMMNPTALPPAYAYFYGGSAMIPGNFQYGAPTLYPVAAGGTTSTHGNTNSGVYGKAPNNFSGNYAGIYENNQGSSTGSSDFKTSTSSGPKVQPTQTANPSTTSDIAANIYSTKSHSALSKSYEKQGFHCATPPPFNIGSQNSGMGPGGGYPPHLFIPAMTPHHSTTTLMHQPIHQDGTNTMSGRSQGNQQAKVVMTKPNYSSSTYWTQN